MANIKNELNNIKNALYGKDVRESIHNGIDAINKEVENTTGRQVDLENTFDQLVINAGNSNAEIVDARVGESGKTYAKLGDRLDDFSSQLAHNINKTSSHTLKLFSLAEVDVTDYSDIINEKISEGYNIIIPVGEYKISKPIIWNGVVNIVGQSQSLSILSPSDYFLGESMIIVESNTKKTLGSISNFNINCNYIANKGVWIKKAEGITCKDLTIKHFKDVGLHIGNGSTVVNASFFTNLKISGDMTYTKQLSEYPNYCVLQDSNSMDNNFSNIFAWNARQSIICDKGGSSRFSNIHVWGDLPSNFPQYCYEAKGIGSIFTNCKADSPQIAGFKVENFQNMISGCEILLSNTNTNNFNASYIEISNNNNSGVQIVNNKGLYTGNFPSKDLILNCDSIASSVLFSNNSFASGWRYASSYDTYYNSIGLNSSRIDIVFPKPLTNNQYSVFAQGLWDCGNCTITNKSTTGFTINFENKNIENSYFLYTLLRRF